MCRGISGIGAELGLASSGSKHLQRSGIKLWYCGTERSAWLGHYLIPCMEQNPSKTGYAGDGNIPLVSCPICVPSQPLAHTSPLAFRGEYWRDSPDAVRVLVSSSPKTGVASAPF